MTTVRFSKVVAECGKPQPYTLWLDPKNDATFQKALKENRILSVHQETTGAKADYGEVGYTSTRGELLLFPKPLNGFEGRRVVGVKYDLLDLPEAEPLPQEPPRSKPKPSEPKTPAPAPKPPAKIHPNIVPFAHDLGEQDDDDEETEQPEPSKLRSLPKEKARPAPKPKPSPEKQKPPAPEPEPGPEPPSAPESAAAPTPPIRKDQQSPTSQRTNVPASALTLLRRAMRDLKDGKVVKAYERLKELELQLTSDQ